MRDPYVAAMLAGLRVQMAREAAASVALSHDEDCTCLACRATAGDEAALIAVLDLLAHPRPGEEGDDIGQ